MIAVGIGMTCLFSLYLLPGEAHDLKSFQVEKEELDKQTKELQLRYSKLEEKLSSFSQLKDSVTEQKDMIQVKTPDEVKK